MEISMKIPPYLKKDKTNENVEKFCGIICPYVVVPCANKWFCCWEINLLEGMSRWFSSKTEIQKWI
jgi:hypothetical protein